MMHYESLKKKIIDRTAVMAVVGLGYVGLPLAVEKARAGYRVIGFDMQQKRVDMVNRAVNYIGDVVDDDLTKLVHSGMIQATTDFSKIRKADCVAICVPTPLDKYQQPDVSYVQNSSRDVAANAHPGMLVVLESTTYPGTTEEIVMPLFEDKGFVIGVDIFLAFSPERVDPGNKKYNTRNTPKVVGGMTANCTELAALLYGNVLEGELFKASSPKVAEMEKLLENTFRNINIALVNEMAILCHRMGIDIWEVIEAASTKPYGFMAFYPGPGLGGHCIPIDPFYLTWKAREFNYHTRLIETAGEINNYMPEYVVERVSSILNLVGKPLNGAKVMLLGAAYKKDIDDLRESPVLKILELLQEAKTVVTLNEPFIPEFTHAGVRYTSQPLDTMAGADIVVVTTDHTVYNAEEITAQAKLVFDTRNITAHIKAPHVFRL
jgi:UDP-N-acetyl-D-glucosamine dehydrogenase